MNLSAIFKLHRRREVLHDLANHDDNLPQVAEPENGLCNEFHQDEKGWVQIAPYGDYPHPGGFTKDGKRKYPKGVIQRVNRAAGEAMANELRTIVGQKVVGERPWYRGHHDQDPIKYPDPNSYAWIKDIANRDDGIYARAEFTPDGQSLIDKKTFKYFSAYWGVAYTGETDDKGRKIMMPVRLNSVAFTNRPNIPVVPLSNEEDAIEGTGMHTAAQAVISEYVANGVLEETDRDEWLGYFNESFTDAAWALANADRSEAARKGWITRRANMESRGQPFAKAAARTRAATRSGPVKKSAVPVGKDLESQMKANSAGKLERQADGRAVWRLQKGQGKASEVARSGAYAVKQHGAGVYSLHHRGGMGPIATGSKAHAYKAAELHEKSQERMAAASPAKSAPAKEPEKLGLNVPKPPAIKAAEEPLKIALPARPATPATPIQHTPTEFQQGVRTNLNKWAATSAQTSTGARKQGLFSKLVDAFKNPHVHDGGAS